MSLCVMHCTSYSWAPGLSKDLPTTCDLRAAIVICFASQSSHECHNAPRASSEGGNVLYGIARPLLIYIILALIHIHINADQTELN